MAGVDVVEEFVEQVTAVAIPQVMVRVDDRQVGLQNRLVVQQQPVLIDLVHAGAGPVGAANLGHGYLPPPGVSRSSH